MTFKIITSIFLIAISFLGAAQDLIFCNQNVKVGADQTELYLPKLAEKKIAVVGNQTSMIGQTHLVDSLLNLGVNVVSVFSPEHGFRGQADAGEKVKSGLDSKTGLPIVSLYGSNKKPKPEQLKGIDLILFDIQDVGARFYTYISTLHYVMEACAEAKIELIVLDRPNPNGHYVDGPVLKPDYKSFVGMHPVPIVHGLTIGEYAQMINGEKWLNNQAECDLTVIKVKGWDHNQFYKLPTKPSPNLPNMLAIYLYPSLCLFEGTVVSVGRGTPHPFQVIGHPSFSKDSFAFTPVPTAGAKHPKLENNKCFGIDFTQQGVDIIRSQRQINLNWMLLFYKQLNLKSGFFLKNNFINLLAGTNELKAQILSGATEAEIRASWSDDLKNYLIIRQKYLLYDDFKN